VERARRPLPGTPARIVLTAAVGAVAALVSSAPREPGGAAPPLFELCASGVAARAEDAGEALISGSTSLSLSLDVFNSHKLAWEPAVEPWRACLRLQAPRPARGGSAPRPQHLRLSLEGADPLELTATPALVEAAAAAGAAFAAVGSVLAEPDTLAARLAGAGGAAPSSLAACCLLVNATGAAVEVWLASPGSDGAPPPPPPAGPPTLRVAPAGRAELRVAPADPGYRAARRAGRPSEAEGVQAAREEVPLEAGGGAAARQPGWRQPRRTLMYFRLEGAGALAGPVHLDR
jgi:hypothetical protein